MVRSVEFDCDSRPQPSQEAGGEPGRPSYTYVRHGDGRCWSYAHQVFLARKAGRGNRSRDRFRDDVSVAFNCGDSAMDERCGFIEPVKGYSFNGTNEQKAGRHGYLCIGAAVLADYD